MVIARLDRATRYSRDAGDEWRGRGALDTRLSGHDGASKTAYSYRTRRDRRRPDGIASTMRQSPIITIPMNSKAKASTAILPQ
jgi:hypothetical protein